MPTHRLHSRQLLRNSALALALCSALPACALVQTVAEPGTLSGQSSSQQAQAEATFKALYEKEATFRAKEFSSKRHSDEDEEAGSDMSDAAERKRLMVWKDFFDQAQKIEVKRDRKSVV